MTRSLILGAAVLIAFVLACAWAGMRIKGWSELLAVAALAVPACAVCGLVFKGRAR